MVIPASNWGSIPLDSSGHIGSGSLRAIGRVGHTSLQPYRFGATWGRGRPYQAAWTQRCFQEAAGACGWDGFFTNRFPGGTGATHFYNIYIYIYKYNSWCRYTSRHMKAVEGFNALLPGMLWAALHGITDAARPRGLPLHDTQRIHSIPQPVCSDVAILSM